MLHVTSVNNEITSKLINLKLESNNPFGICWILLAPSNESFTVKSLSVKGFNRLVRNLAMLEGVLVVSTVGWNGVRTSNFYEFLVNIEHIYNNVIDNCKILESCNNWATLQYLEAYYIKTNSPMINVGLKASKELPLFK